MPPRSSPSDHDSPVVTSSARSDVNLTTSPATLPTVGDGLAFDTIVAAQDQMLNLNTPGAISMFPQHSEVQDELNPDRNGPSESSINTGSGTGLTTGTTCSVLSTEDSGIPQCNLIPYWELEDGFQSYYLDSLLVSNGMDLDQLNLSFLGATGEYPLQAPSRDEVQASQHDMVQPEAAQQGQCAGIESDSVLQRSWHTYCIAEPSGHITPEHRQDPGRVDEEYHRQLSSRLEPRVQQGTLPSTSFLVRPLTRALLSFYCITPQRLNHVRSSIDSSFCRISVCKPTLQISTLSFLSYTRLAFDHMLKMAFCCFLSARWAACSWEQHEHFRTV